MKKNYKIIQKNKNSKGKLKKDFLFKDKWII